MSSRKRVAGAALVLLAPVLAVLGTTTASQADTAGDLTAKFQAYGNSSGQWSGGDGSQSQLLPDGRVLWFFSDTFHGSVTNGVRRPFADPWSFINNSMVIQDKNGNLVDTVEGARVVDGKTYPDSLVRATNTSEFLWGAGQTVAGGAVQKFYMRVEKTGDGDLDFVTKGVELVRMPISTITNPGSYSKVGLPADVKDCKAGGAAYCTLWGIDLLDWKDPADGKTYTYVYGVEQATDLKEKRLKVARVPQGDFTAAGWQFWNGSTWVPGAKNAKVLMNGVQEGFSVAPVGNRLVLLTQDSGPKAPLFQADMYSYSSATPTGFTQASRSHLFATPESTTDSGRYTYEFRIVEHLTSGNTIVASYNTNSMYWDGACNRDAIWNASVYRPRFKTLVVPTTATGGADKAPTTSAPATWSTTKQPYCDAGTVPTATSLSAPSLPGAQLHLTWKDPKAGLWFYEMQYRDVTAGQAFEPVTAPNPDTRTRTGFFFPVSPNKWQVGGLHHDHAYEFRVRATTWTGRTSAWVTARGTAKLSTPTNVKATRPRAGYCKVSWTDGQPSVMWQIRERNSRTGAQRVLGYYMDKSVELGKPLANDTYTYAVRAGNSMAPGAWSSAASC